MKKKRKKAKKAKKANKKRKKRKKRMGMGQKKKKIMMRKTNNE